VPDGSALRIVEVPFDDPRLADLLDERRRDLESRYGVVNDHPADPTDPSEFRFPTGASLMVVIDGVPVACGALRHLEDGVAEIKRMFVGEAYRRRGLASATLLALEEQARRFGYAVARLETGAVQPEAMAFYEANGYRRIDCYRQWSGYRLSVCYEKRLTRVRSDREDGVEDLGHVREDAGRGQPA
jgi:putative acetyltransferase